MTNCTPIQLEFPALKRRKIQAQFCGGQITSDGGVMLLNQIDQQLGLVEAVNAAIPDTRDPRYVRHSQLSLLRQRIYGLCLGYEDLNDHDQLREDLGIQTAVGRESCLGSSPTLCRLENRADRAMAVSLHRVMLEQFIDSFKRAPKKLVLDFDATDDRVHGDQQGKFFHGYYDHYCFLPLYVFCKKQLLVSYLRPSKIDGAKHAWAILSLLVKRFRQAWPKVRIIFRGDSGFCRWKMLRWCERHDVGYIVGIARNARLERAVGGLLDEAAQQVAHTQDTVRRFTEFYYQAGTWDCARRVIAKIEVSLQGRNPRYIVTNLPGAPATLYEKTYCARSDMENQIKQQQLDLYADRTSCHAWWANQFRLLLSSIAYILLESIRRIGLKGTELANVYVGTIRLKLLKIGAVIIHNTRRIRFLLASAYPYQALFATVTARLSPG